MIEVRGAIEFDSIRVYLNEKLHIDIRRSAYRGHQVWRWPGNFKIEFSIADAFPMLVEYTSEELCDRVSEELKRLPLNGE